jgi:hypothetical protein
MNSRFQRTHLALQELLSGISYYAVGPVCLTNVKKAFVTLTLVVALMIVPILVPLGTLKAEEATEATANNLNIVKVGTRAYASAAEFGPMAVGKASISNISDTVNIISVENVPLVQLIPTNEYGNNLFRNGSNITLHDATYLSNSFNKTKANYIGASFRTLFIGNARDNHNGIVWSDDERDYYAFLRLDRLVLHVDGKGEVAWAQAIRTPGNWDTLMVLYVGDLIHIFLNGEDKIQFKASPARNH